MNFSVSFRLKLDFIDFYCVFLEFEKRMSVNMQKNQFRIQYYGSYYGEGYFEWVGFFIMRIVDAFLAIPRLPLIIVIAVFIRPGTRYQESHIYIHIIWMAIHCPHYTLRGAITQKFHIRLVKMVDASAAPGLCITFTILSLTFIYGTITFYQNVHPLNHLKLSLYLYAMG